ncbi:MAG: MFS transporter [Slackia sp.]
MVPADVRTQRSYTAERAHKLAVKVKDIPSSAKKVAKKTMDDVAMTPFLRKISFFSSGGSFLDGYVLSLIGVALTQIVTMFNLTAAESAAIGASVMVGIFFGTIFGGYLTDAIGRKKMFTIDIIAIAVFSILSVFATTPLQLVLARFFIGVFVGADYPTPRRSLLSSRPRSIAAFPWAWCRRRGTWELPWRPWWGLPLRRRGRLEMMLEALLCRASSCS